MGKLQYRLDSSRNGGCPILAIGIRKECIEGLEDLKSTILNLKNFTKGKKYNTIYADPPWQFQNRTGKVAPEHKRLNRYGTMKLEEIKAFPLLI